MSNVAKPKNPPEADRASRDLQDRESEQREVTWQRSSMLPTPDPREGVSFRWCRTSTLGNSDNPNISSKFREGWTPCLAKDHPELKIISDFDSRFPENIENGGLLLCQTATENVVARQKAQAQTTAGQIEAVDNSYLRQSDSRMPVLPSQRSTQFGD
jgi:hypothetical protein